MSRKPILLAAALLLAACAPRGGDKVRTSFQAVEAAQRSLRAAGIDEQVAASDRHGAVWIVLTRKGDSRNRVGHVVTVEAATGKVSFDRYQSVQIGVGP